MERYDAERMELSTRDRVALAAYTEIKEGRGTPNGGVWLDVSHLPREVIMERLPRVYQTLLDVQMLDITRDPIEIAPTAHYSMGGVWVRPEDHGTDVDGLYAIGEAASGLHGANRLGVTPLSNYWYSEGLWVKQPPTTPTTLKRRAVHSQQSQKPGPRWTHF